MWGIIRGAPTQGRALWSAVFWLLLGTGLRSSEARQLARADVELSDGHPRSIGHVVVRAENAKSAAGIREVPLDPGAELTIRNYLRGREMSARGPEPLFVTTSGAAFTKDGWNAMHQRIRRTIREAGGGRYQPHRLRNTWARDMLEADVPETVILQLAGWADGEMLRRYVGRLSVPALKRYPTTLAKIRLARANAERFRVAARLVMGPPRIADACGTMV
jgi:integrase